MKLLLVLIIFILTNVRTSAQLKISADKHYLLKSDGTSFFWLGDTAWELFHRLNKEEARIYLQNRADKGFNVVMAAVLADLDGLNTPNANGDKPLLNNDPEKPLEPYFKHVDYIVKEAARRGIYMALLPTWGDKWNKESFGIGPEIFTPENAKVYGAFLAKRYANYKNIIWVLGGDRNPKNDVHIAIIRSMAEGIRSADKTHLITYHPMGASSSYDFFAAETWIDFNMSQTGHKAGNPDYKQNLKAYTLEKIKPHINGEPNYEDHPNDWKPAEKGWLDDFDTREAAYWNMLSGGAGHTYGNHNIWQMYDEKRESINNARTRWKVAVDARGAFNMGYMKKMFETRDWQKLVPDQAIIESDNPEGLEYKIAANWNSYISES